MSGRALPPVTTVAPCADRVVDVRGDRVELSPGDQRAHVGRVVERRWRGSSPRPGGRSGPRSGRRPGRRRTSAPSTRTAARPTRSRPGRRPRPRGRGRRRAARASGSCRRARARQPISRCGRLCGDRATGPGRAGEADVVGVVDDRAADHRSFAVDDLPDVARQPGLGEQVERRAARSAASASRACARPRCRRAAQGARRRSPS